MLAPPSLQNPYTLCFSGDPSLNLPAVPPEPANETLEQKAAREAPLVTALKNARETGNWPVKPGESPTRFNFKPVGGSAVRWWFGESQRQSLSALEDIELMFRLALDSIDGLPGVTVQHDKRGKFPLVSVATMDQIYASGAGPAAVYELGAYVAERSIGGVPPL
jgi:hypothetical protein